MDVHPFCLILPDMDEKEYARLREDISANGLRDPVTSYSGMILDGRHRWRACQESGQPPRVVPFVGDDAAALAFVKSRNTRRNLNPTQRAWVAKDFMERERAMARARMSKGGGDKKSGRENLPDPITDKGKATDKAGAAMGVSGRLVADAVKVAKSATAPLVQAIKAGAIHMDEAKTIATLGRESQKRLVAISNKTERKHATESARNASRGKHKVAPRTVTLPGTSFVRAFLNQVERAATYTREEGCHDPEAAAARLIAEIDWKSESQMGQLDRCAYTATIMNALCKHREQKAA